MIPTCHWKVVMTLGNAVEQGEILYLTKSRHPEIFMDVTST